mmetsp:Transcript_12782/g.25646  ORF Transcript_12782/g.25646 Transcript_12782/m.25646 type:complete len:109 (-) Transcript_12782:480-806(-)
MSLLCKWSVHRRRHYSSRWLSSSESLQLFFHGSGTARVDGSCRQSYFGPVVLWWLWDGSSSLAICRVACSSVVDDAAIAHVSTVEWAFWELSATDIFFAWRRIKEIKR